jgi:hypothetical protein
MIERHFHFGLWEFALVASRAGQFMTVNKASGYFEQNTSFAPLPCQ